MPTYAACACGWRGTLAEIMAASSQDRCPSCGRENGLRTEPLPPTVPGSREDLRAVVQEALAEAIAHLPPNHRGPGEIDAEIAALRRAIDVKDARIAFLERERNIQRERAQAAEGEIDDALRAFEDWPGKGNPAPTDGPLDEIVRHLADLADGYARSLRDREAADRPLVEAARNALGALRCCEPDEAPERRARSDAGPDCRDHVAWLAQNFWLGEIMDEVARRWRDHDPIGALTVGPCVLSVQGIVAQLDAALPPTPDPEE